MSNFPKSTFPHILVSEYQGPPILNFAGANGGGDGGSPDDDDPDAPPDGTPEGEKWRKLRQEKKDADERAATAEKEKIAAEAARQATEELLEKIQGKTPKEEKPKDEPDGDDIPVNADDAAYVNKLVKAALKDSGLDAQQIKETMATMEKSQQQIQADRIFTEAKSNLREKYQDSPVPYDHEAALKYAKDNGLGLVGTTAEQALEIAHKEMNEEAYAQWIAGGRKPKKEVPSLENTGSGSKGSPESKVDEDWTPESVSDAAAMAHKMVSRGDV